MKGWYENEHFKVEGGASVGIPWMTWDDILRKNPENKGIDSQVTHYLCEACELPSGDKG